MPALACGFAGCCERSARALVGVRGVWVVKVRLALWCLGCERRLGA